MSRGARPSEALLDKFRAHRAVLPPLTNLYPYAMGRIEAALKDGMLKPAQRVQLALEMIAALDIVEAEPKTERKPMQCPECGVGRPGHGAGCSRAPVAILGPRS